MLYAFHMYEPYAATSAPNMKRDQPLRYPGVITEYAGGQHSWDKAAVAAHIDTAFDWANSQGLPPTRIVAAEFGCMRRWRDCGVYLGDVLDAVYRSDSPFSVAEARLTNALAGETSRALIKAEDELARMLPGFERAMQSAARAFGRAEALKNLRSAARDDDKLDQARRLRGTDM